MCVFLLLAVGSLLPVPPIFYQRYISPTNKTEAQQNSQELYETLYWRQAFIVGSAVVTTRNCLARMKAS